MYTALYRKKRPTNFESVVGQKPIVTTLKNQLQGGQISHAYLFCGTRGTGKTSTAKIFARAVNCQQSVETGEPCNNCEVCQDILSERNLDVIEIDAASNNGVDNIRDLREEVKYPPTAGIYKVYIIDEAHMLTTAAFNALLKTLEEPPDHVIFILATTDPQKIPATILSRCQRYDFKRITRKDMVETLANYMENDNLLADRDALDYIASVSDGAMRDALSILDQCLSLYSNETITLEKVQNLLGAMDQSALFAFGNALLKNDASYALNIIAQAAKQGKDISRFIADIITHFRNLLVASQIADNTDILDYSPETIENFRAQGSAANPLTLISYIKEFSELQNQMRFLPQERLALEVCTIKLCSKPQHSGIVTPSPTESVYSDNKAKGDMPDANIELPEVKGTQTVKDDKSTITVKEEKSVSDDTNIVEKWTEFCGSLNGLLKSMLALCQVECSGSNITIICRDQGSLQYIKDQKDTITFALTSYFNLPAAPNIVFTINNSYNDPDTFKKIIQNQVNLPVDFQ